MKYIGMCLRQNWNPIQRIRKEERNETLSQGGHLNSGHAADLLGIVRLT